MRTQTPSDISSDAHSQHISLSGAPEALLYRHLDSLQRIAAQIMLPRTTVDLGKVIASEAMRATGALGAQIGVLDQESRMIEYVSGVGQLHPVFYLGRRICVGSPAPAAVALQTRTDVFVNPDNVAEYPTAGALFQAAPEIRAAALLPLYAAGQSLGVLAFGFPGASDLTTMQRRYLATVGANCRQGLERLVLQESLVDLHERLEQRDASANAVRQAFARLAAHELRTPLAALILQIGSMGRSGIIPSAKMERLEAQTQRLSHVIETLEAAYLLGASRPFLKFEVCSLQTTVQEVADEFEPQATRLGHRLQVFNDEPLWGYWDAPRVSLMVVHLLSNACRHADGSDVCLRVQQVDYGRVHIEVQDHGMGISPAAQVAIFAPHEPPLGRDDGGLGMGLWVTRRLTELMGGQLRIQSHPGEGCRVTLCLPADALAPACGPCAAGDPPRIVLQ